MNIPTVKTWLVRAIDTDGREIGRRDVLAPTKTLARLNMIHDADHLPTYVSWLRHESFSNCKISRTKGTQHER